MHDVNNNYNKLMSDFLKYRTDIGSGSHPEAKLSCLYFVFLSSSLSRSYSLFPPCGWPCWEHHWGDSFHN